MTTARRDSWRNLLRLDNKLISEGIVPVRLLLSRNKIPVDIDKDKVRTRRAGIQALLLVLPNDNKLT